MGNLYRGKTETGKTVTGVLFTEERMVCLYHEDKETQHYIIVRRGIDWGFPYKYLKVKVLNDSVSAYTDVDVVDEDKFLHRVFENDVLSYDGHVGVVKYDKDLCKFKVYFKEFALSLNKLNAHKFIYVKGA